MKTMAIRVDPEIHFRLTTLARLNKRSLSDELLEAVNNHLEGRFTEEALQAQASEALAEIDREAATRRQAIESLLKPAAKSSASGEPPVKRRGGRR